MNFIIKDWLFSRHRQKLILDWKTLRLERKNLIKIFEKKNKTKFNFNWIRIYFGKKILLSKKTYLVIFI